VPKTLITGATGQVGSRVVALLAETHQLGIISNEDIIVLARTPSKADFLRKLHVSIIQGSLQDKHILKSIFEKHDIENVIHLAANVSVYANIKEMYKDNVIGTKNILEEFVQSTAKTFLYSSSIVVYDHSIMDGKIGEFFEEDPLGTMTIGSDKPYTITKRISDQMVHKYRQKFPQKTFITVRLGPVSGPGDRQIIPSLVKTFPLPVPKLVEYGKGVISITSGIDCARALIFLIENADRARNEVYNIAQTTIDFYHIFSVVAKFYRKKPPVVSIPLKMFKIFHPILTWIKKLFPKNNFIQTLFSETALEYFSHTYVYNSEKLQQLGFQFISNPAEAILEGLQWYDPKKTLI
jgi:nucleoside-diphosphate-sugar epimerase